MFRIAKIEYRGPVPGKNLTVAVQKQINADGFRQLGEYWHQAIRPKHFTNAASRLYGYQPRQGEAGRPGLRGFRNSYTGRKLRRFGHTRPLVFTGRSQRMTEIGRIEVKSTKAYTEVKVVMNAPGLNRRYKGSTINMRAELTTISADEARMFTEMLNDYISLRYAELSNRTTTN